jgi:hypothetical protein
MQIKKDASNGNFVKVTIAGALFEVTPYYF